MEASRAALLSLQLAGILLGFLAGCACFWCVLQPVIVLTRRWLSDSGRQAYLKRQLI